MTMTTLNTAKLTLAPILLAANALWAQDAAPASKPVNDLPNPYKTVSDWAKLPDGWTWGATGGVAIDPAGNVWVLTRRLPGQGRQRHAGVGVQP